MWVTLGMEKLDVAFGLAARRRLADMQSERGSLSKDWSQEVRDAQTLMDLGDDARLRLAGSQNP